MLSKWHDTHEQVLNAKFTMAICSLIWSSVPLAGTVTFLALLMKDMSTVLPPREELPSPESQSGETLAPPFGGAFFMARQSSNEIRQDH